MSDDKVHSAVQAHLDASRAEYELTRPDPAHDARMKAERWNRAQGDPEAESRFREFYKEV